MQSRAGDAVVTWVSIRLNDANLNENKYFEQRVQEIR